MCDLHCLPVVITLFFPLAGLFFFLRLWHLHISRGSIPLNKSLKDTKPSYPILPSGFGLKYYKKTVVLL